MTDRHARVSALLSEVAELHRRVYRIVDGADDDWASWYADWLIRLSELPQVLDVTPVRSELVFVLVGLDRAYTNEQPADRWEDYYAGRMVEHFAIADRASS